MSLFHIIGQKTQLIIKHLKIPYANKIEKDEVLSLLETKSNTQDTSTAMKATDILHKQLKHIIVILIEILRRDLSNFTHPKNTSKKDLTIMLDQTMSIARWINSFDPENINTIDLKLPKSLGEFQNYVNVTLDGVMTNFNKITKKFKSKQRLDGSITELRDFTSRHISSRQENRTQSPKTTKFVNSAFSKRNSKYKWEDILKKRRQCNRNELSYTHHENSTSQDQSESAYILIDEPRVRYNTRQMSRTQAKSMARTAKLQNQLFNL
jgi:hypothetical protein